MNIAKWNRDLQTRTGFRFHVRSVNPDDVAVLAEFFTHVTPDDLRFRFLSSINVVSHGQLSALVNVDHRTKENFLAVDSDGITIFATAMLACDPALTVGEVAISIRPDFKGRGVSWEYLNMSRILLRRWASGRSSRSKAAPITPRSSSKARWVSPRGLTPATQH